eukprot:c20716_g1_i1.p1 GENE.c20716_g1_i1~~c20716_g1_i1.p1  ORF type:complete len:587 (+),score=151.13 c20716_g1_i1:35-1762(+)
MKQIEGNFFQGYQSESEIEQEELNEALPPLTRSSFNSINSSNPVSILKNSSRNNSESSFSVSSSAPVQKVRFWEPVPLINESRSPGTRSPQSGSPFLSPIKQSEAERLPLLSSASASRNSSDLRALRQRMKFYRALAKTEDSFDITEYPPHVLPPIFGVFDMTKGNCIKKQSSISTIFSIFNTMMGPTILVIPWAFACAELVPATIVLVLFYFVSMYTCSVLVSRGKYENSMDFPSVCTNYLGIFPTRIFQIASIALKCGSAIANHYFISTSVKAVFGNNERIQIHIATIFSAVAVFILSMIKNPRLLIRFNSFGVISVLLTIFFVIFESSPIGDLKEILNSTSPVISDYIPKNFTLKSIAPLSGILGMSFNVHNSVLSILANNANPQSHQLFVVIAFTIAFICYFLIGLIPNLYVISADLRTFQNFLMAFPDGHIFACVVRGVIVIQLVAVYPLWLYSIRAELFGSIFGLQDIYPNAGIVLLLNIGIIITTTLVVIAIDGIGDIARWIGAFCGLFLIFLIPMITEVCARYQNLGEILIAFEQTRTLKSYFQCFNISSVLIVTIGIFIAILQFLN